MRPLLMFGGLFLVLAAGGVWMWEQASPDHRTSDEIAGEAGAAYALASAKLDNTGLTGDFESDIGDQSVGLHFHDLPELKSQGAQGFADYYNRVTENRCESLLTLIDAQNGAYRFAQSAKPGEISCSLFPEVTVSNLAGGNPQIGVASFDVRWNDAKDGRQLMAGSFAAWGD